MPTYTSYSGELANKLQEYRAKGQKDASRNRPPPDSGSPDQHESALKSEAESWVNAQQALFDNAVVDVSRAVVESRQKAGDWEAQVSMLVSDDTTTSGVEAELAGLRTPLVKATERRLKLEADYNYFRVHNNIHEEADYPESRYMHFGIIAVLALVETVVNTVFYENAQGLIGGFVVALGIALFNLLTSMALGVGFRYKNLADSEKKVLGWLALAAFVLLAVFSNALFAAFRAQYQLVVDPSEVEQLNAAFHKAWPEALLIFKLDPQFHDITSFLLFGLGILLSLTAFYKGYTFDDKFPSHGAKDRAFKKALEEELRQQEQVRQKVKELLHQRKSAVQAALQEPAAQIGLLARRVADLTHARGALENQAAAVQRDYAMVTEAYRHANTAVRALPPPAYFKEPAVLTLKPDGSAADRVLAELKDVQDQLKTVAEQWREKLQDKLKELQNDSHNILNSLLSQFMAEVAKEAQEQVSRGIQTIHRVKAA
jgi:hypothetical protein